MVFGVGRHGGSGRHNWHTRQARASQSGSAWRRCVIVGRGHGFDRSASPTGRGRLGLGLGDRRRAALFLAFAKLSGSHRHRSGRACLAGSASTSSTRMLNGDRSGAAHLEDLQAHRPFRDFVYELKGGRADCRWVLITGFPRFDGEGRFAGYRGIGRNVTALAGAFENLGAESRRRTANPPSILPISSGRWTPCTWASCCSTPGSTR